MDKSAVRRLMPFLLLSVLVHGMLLFGLRINLLNSAKPVPVLNVLLQVAPGNPGRLFRGSSADSGKAEMQSSPHIISLPSSSDLVRESLALASRFAYEDSQIAGKEPRIPAAWVGTYQGTYSGGNPTLEKVGLGFGRDYGKIRLNITENGEITNCTIFSNALGKIVCSGAIDASGNLVFLVPDSDLFEAKFAGMVLVDASGPHFSGNWTAIHFPTGQPFRGEFRSAKVMIQALADM